MSPEGEAMLVTGIYGSGRTSLVEELADHSGAVRDDADVERIRAALPCPLRVLPLATSIAVVERRLTAIPTSGRAHDLAVAKAWVSQGLGQVSADLTLPGDAPLSTLAEQVASWLDWPRVR